MMRDEKPMLPQYLIFVNHAVYDELISSLFKLENPREVLQPSSSAEPGT